MEDVNWFQTNPDPSWCPWGSIHSYLKNMTTLSANFNHRKKNTVYHIEKPSLAVWQLTQEVNQQKQTVETVKN